MLTLPVPGYKCSISRCGTRVLGIYEKARKPFVTRDGYVYVSVYRSDGARKNMAIHRLVWLAFEGPIPPKMWMNHKDGVKTNNDLSNLELTTPAENHRHARDVLKRQYAKRHNFPNAKLTRADCVAVVRLSREGMSQRKIAALFKVSQVTIHHILKKAIAKNPLFPLY